MNSKKSKKNRAKTETVTQNVISSDTCEKIEVTVDRAKRADIQSSDEKTCDATETVLQTASIPPIEGESPENVPDKPKRKKGKKKKIEESDERKEGAAQDETANQIRTTLLEVGLPDTTVSDAESVTKTKNRKKKKSKKHVESHGSEEVNTQENLPEKIELEISETRGDVIPSPEPKAKKKHKTKKHHSEPENTENVTCTSAFQQILDSGDAQDDSVLPENMTETLILEDKIEESLDDLETIQPAKNKKKNKKHKKHLPPGDSEKPDEDCKELSEVMPKSIATETICAVVDELTPKPKAIIAKPVDKKRKNKNLATPEHTTDTELLASEIKNVDMENIQQKHEVQNIIEVHVEEGAQQSENIVKIINSETKNITEKDIGKDMECQRKENDINICERDITNELIEIPFTEVRPSRKKKRSSKSTSEQNENKPATENVDTKKVEQLEDSNTTPDSVYHPRSSSQQECDNNNNMVIQEINSPDEVRLGIPVLMAIPVIQGSGESPEVRCQDDPLNVEVTELKTNKANIKEGIAFDRETDETPLMEELKQSIEKSLAQLTVLENSEIEAGKHILDEMQDRLDTSVKTIKEPLISRSENKTEKQDSDVLQDILSTPEHTSVLSPPDEVVPTDDNIEPEDKAKVKEESGEPPLCPTRKDKKGKSRKKGKKPDETARTTAQQSNTATSSIATNSKKTTQETSKDKESKTEKSSNKGKQQPLGNKEADVSQDSTIYEANYEPIENFEDALTSSTEDINQTFELIAKEANEKMEVAKSLTNPEISITEPDEDKEDRKENPVSPPKNLLGHPNIPVQPHEADYKKEKDKPPNSLSAEVRIKDSVDVEKPQKPKESQSLENKLKQNSEQAGMCKINGNDEFVYKYSFRKVFLANICHVCDKGLVIRVPCKYCNLLFYCCKKHKDEDWSKHQSLCFAVCTITHLKDQKFIYGNAKDVTGQDYRLLRMQTIMSCEKMLKRKLLPWEQEALLYPRMCADVGCRQWRQGLLTDCGGCGQVAFCTDHPEHLPSSHQSWCKSYALYYKFVTEQLCRGRLEPKLPNKMLTCQYDMPEKMNDVLAMLFEEKVDMDSLQYAMLTHVASAALTVAHSLQLSRKNANGFSKRALSIHVVEAELQFEADVLNKWELFFLHLRPDVKDLRVVLIGANLNPSNLPLDLLSKAKLCEPCCAHNRRLLFSFEDKKTYRDYYTSEDFILPDIVCAFNPSIDRSSVYKGKDPWPASVKCISKLRRPFLITSYTMQELTRDISRVQKIAPFDVISEGSYNKFASVKPDRNFITDDEMPLLYKNYCFSVLCGA